MHLRTLTLRNWKAFSQARFDFPAPSEGRNVILIGGKNGHGKTSLFEALALGLYGRDGLRLVQRAGPAATEERLAQSYRSFMTRAFNAQAAREQRGSAHVGLIFENEDGEKIEIERTWHFGASGDLRQNDPETLRVLKGAARRVVEPPRTEQDPEGWWREWIAQAFLPPNLAPFFLFDGEAASAYAERDMGVQVKEGIDGLLGLVWLRRLAQSLRDYAANRRSQVVRGIDAATILQLEAAVKQLEVEVAGAEARLKEIETTLASLEEERRTLTQKLAGSGGRTRAELGDLLREKADAERELQKASEELSKLVDGPLPFSLAGGGLREMLIDRLGKEARREQWLASAAETRDRAASVLAAAANAFAGIAPPLTEGQNAQVREAISAALERLWNPPPQDVAEGFRHEHATGRLREAVRARLEDAASITAGTVSDILEKEARLASALRKLNAEIESAQETGEGLEGDRERLDELNRLIAALSREEGEKRNIVSSRGEDLRQKRAELARLTQTLDQTKRPARLAKRAEEIALMLDDLLRDARPLQSREIADEMTRAIGAMAHKKDLFRRVDITPDGDVRLLGPGGQNLRDYDLAAGEKQVFTQALFAAVAAVSQRVFPLVIDTPLGRLDEEHRIGVLRFLAARPSQVILISTDTEVVGPYLDAVRNRVAGAWLLRNTTVGDSGRSWVERGYFPGQSLSP